MHFGRNPAKKEDGDTKIKTYIGFIFNWLENNLHNSDYFLYEQDDKCN